MTHRSKWLEADSEDEWQEDDSAEEDGEASWPPHGRAVPLGVDLWKAAERRIYGGLQKGSTCVSVNLQNYQRELQGVRARAANEKWDPNGACTDEGHIDWLLASAVGSPSITVRQALVCTEQVISDTVRGLVRCVCVGWSGVPTAAATTA